MDLSSSSKRSSQLNRLQQTRSVSLDDDDMLSNNSSSSFNILLAAASDSESQSPVSVRDMIKRYDTVAKLGTRGGTRSLQPQQNTQPQPQQRQPHGLPAMKSAYSGMNKFGTHTISHRFPLRQYVTQMQDVTGNKLTQTRHRKGIQNSDHSNNNKIKGGSKLNDNSCVAKKDAIEMEDCCMMHERLVSLSDSENNYIADHTRRSSSLQAFASAEKSSPELTDGIEEANQQPMETSYQSKTTIAKTAGGVRIIIDIFFDQEHQPVSATDVVGSRVETDIPQSRILNEFQQQAADAQLAHN